MFKSLFSRRLRRWWWTTLLVIAAVGVMIRLGVWQLDRLAERRIFNARVNAQIAQPTLTLTADSLDTALAEMEYRPVVVVGTYDPAQEVALRNQVWQGQLGVHLLTPLVIAGSDRAVLVNRGWVPADETDWGKFAETGTVTVKGIIRLSQSKPDFGGLPDLEGQLRLWNMVNVERITEQISHPMLPIYIQEAPDPAWTSLPYRTQPQLDLSEGSHFGYAIQWFLFAAVLGIGYPFYVRDSLRRAQTHTSETLAVQRILNDHSV
ncbi:MAG TPA: SURF1 family protein [Anaerolineales bacterium]|nr:SURF1 family protein [Anaerolineales bacterium]